MITNKMIKVAKQINSNELILVEATEGLVIEYHGQDFEMTKTAEVKISGTITYLDESGKGKIIWGDGIVNFVDDVLTINDVLPWCTVPDKKIESLFTDEDEDISAKYFDVSFHFTLKTQKIEDIKNVINEFLEKTNLIQRKYDENSNVALVVHNCFLTRKIVIEKGFDTELVDFINSIGDVTVNWFDEMQNISEQRMKMLVNLKRLNGLAIFVGDNIEGVADEMVIVKELGIATIHIKI